MIHNVIFDIAGVIAQWTPVPWLKDRFGQELGPRLWEAAMGDGYWGGHVDRGDVTEEEFFRRARSLHPELAGELTTLEREWPEILQPRKDTEELIRRLKAAGYRVYYLSNFPNKTFEYTFRKIPAFAMTDGGVVSSREMLVKPEPEIYRRLLDRYRLRTEESVFTDDTLPNVEAARALGIAAWHFSDAAGFEGYLKGELGMAF